MARTGRALVFLGLAGALAGGCATGDIEMLATLSGGQQLRVPISRGGAVLTNQAGIQIGVANLAQNPEKKLIHVFAFTDSRGRALRSVRVDDVSDEAPVTLVDDPAPTLTAAGAWHHESEPFDLNAPHAKWLATISNSLRVYRFTLTFADGQTVVLHQGTLFTAAMKAGVRQAMGQNY